MSIREFPLLIIVHADGTVLLKQFKNTSDCKKEWLIARSSGLDAYYHIAPIKKKATSVVQGAVCVYL
jgi:hypothetical protein